MNNISLLFYNLFYLIAVITVGNFINSLFKFKYSNLIEKNIYAFALGNLFYSLTFIYLGYLHFLHANLLLVLYLLPIIFLCRYLFVKYNIKNLIIFFEKWFTRYKVSFKEITILLLFILMLLPVVPHLFSFPTSWDVLAYHLVLPKLYLQENQIVFYEWFSQTTNPIGIEALFSFGELIGESRMGNLIVFDFVVILIASFFYCLRDLFKIKVVLLALILLLFKKILYSEVSFNPYVDFPLAFYSFLLMLNYLRFLKENRRQDLLFAIVFSLYVVLIKLSGIIIGMAFLITTILYFITLNKKIVKEIVLKILNKNTILLITILLAPAIVLYISNYLNTGNPIFPFFNNIFQGRFYNENDAKILLVDFKRQNLTFDMILKFLLHTGTEPAEILLILRESLFSFVLVVFTVMGLLHKEKPIKFLSIFCLFSYAVVFLIAGFPAYRYALPVIPAMSLLSSYIFFDLLDKWRFVKAPLVILFVFSLFAQITSTAGYAKEFLLQNTESGLKAMLSDIKAREGLTYQDNWLAIDYVNKNLSKDKDRVLNLFDNRLYYYQIPVIYAEPSVFLFFNNSKDNNIDKIVAQLRKEKVTYLVANTNWGVPRNLNADLYKTFLRERATNVASYSGIIVYKLK